MPKRTRMNFAALALTGFFWAFAAPQNVQAQAAVTEVSVTHTGCFGRCPVYEVTLRRDGTATFIGSRYVGKIGTYTANIGGFDRLARAISAHGFPQLKSQYTQPITDQSHTITTVVSAGKRKTVDDYAHAGPQALWEIETLIDGIVAEAQWKKVSSSTKFR